MTASCGSWYLAIRLPTRSMRLLAGVYSVGLSTSSKRSITASDSRSAQLTFSVGRLLLVGLHHRRRRHLQLGVRRVQVERGDRGAPVVDVAVRPGGGDGFDAVEDDVLP